MPAGQAVLIVIDHTAGNRLKDMDIAVPAEVHHTLSIVEQALQGRQAGAVHIDAKTVPGLVGINKGVLTIEDDVVRLAVVEAGKHGHPGIAQDLPYQVLDRLDVGTGGHICPGCPVLGEHIGDAGH